jgi:hypothetical protein
VGEGAASVRAVVQGGGLSGAQWGRRPSDDAEEIERRGASGADYNTEGPEDRYPLNVDPAHGESVSEYGHVRGGGRRAAPKASWRRIEQPHEPPPLEV